MKKLLCFAMLLFLVVFSMGCTNKTDCYISDDLSGLVIYGEEYIPIDLGDLQHISLGENIGELRLQKWNPFSMTVSACFVEADIPLVYVSTYELKSNYFCPKSRYEECVAYINQLQWSELRSGYEKDKVLSLELSSFLIQKYFEGACDEEYLEEWNDKYFYPIIQYDTTGSFSRKLGTIVVRDQGDCYFFPIEMNYVSTDHYFPQGEEYNQISEKLKNLLVPCEFWDELTPYPIK